ncbi:YgaP family membrane protein [Peribacillus alkalitolerans]|uniref:YgaP family membrane protein n=1 Tax=Peribacillus alkalitolerans TaxID=1550385 RepID=UPI0013D6369F|nr:DUF2892 domain-containing protein [Peribacillus alkalitolerans]
MNVKSNIGIINALIRITVGFTLLSLVTAKMVKRPYKESYILIAMMAAMKIAEGILRYCPLTQLYENRDHAEDKNLEKKMNSIEEELTKAASAINPS